MPTNRKQPSKEIHVFVLWQNSRHAEKKILGDINKRFKVLKIYEVHWSKEKFTQNLSRFYGTLLAPDSKKEHHIGTGPFLAIIVEDQKPDYRVHTTSRGDKYVNSNPFLAKADHRMWAGGSHVTHGSSTQAEADHNMTLLFGKNSQDFVKSIEPDGGKKIEKWPKDLVGAHGWESLAQLFYALNNTIEYVVLRNFEPLPDRYYADTHGDIDLLVDNYKEASFILNAQPVFKSETRVHNTVVIGGEKVKFDFRYVGDNYYDEKWEQDILKNRKLNGKGFYTPAQEDYFYSQLYHAIVQKPETGKDYIEKLIKLAPSVNAPLSKQSFSNGEDVRLLSQFLLKRSYAFTQPEDRSVYFRSGHIKAGQAMGVKFLKKRRTPLRNYLKRGKVPLKHYVAKIKRMIKVQAYKIKSS